MKIIFPNWADDNFDHVTENKTAKCCIYRKKILTVAYPLWGIKPLYYKTKYFIPGVLKKTPNVWFDVNWKRLYSHDLSYIFWILTLKSLLLYQRLVRDEKLREVTVSSFLRADNYAVAEEILVNKYCTQASWLGETQSSDRRQIMVLPRWMIQNVFDAM